jgi:hypothetical protein
MAISDQCKFELKANVDRVKKEKQISRRKAIALLANELGLVEETARKKDYRARKELGQFVPTSVGAPKCIRCDDKRAVMSKKTGKPMKHGLCRQCKIADNGNHNGPNHKKVSKKAQREFDKISIDPKAEKFWYGAAAKIEALFEVPAIGKVGIEVFRRVKSAQGLMNNYVKLMEEESIP